MFTHSVKVRWADCDPAKIAFTGRISYFALEAIDAWWESVLGDDWFRLNIDEGIGLPFVHMSLDFCAVITPRYPLECKVHMIRLGTSSVQFYVSGTQNAALCFEGVFVEAFVDAVGHSASMPVPDAIRTLLSPQVCKHPAVVRASKLVSKSKQHD